MQNIQARRVHLLALVLASLAGLGWPLLSSLAPLLGRWLTGFQTDWRFLQLSWANHPFTGIPGMEPWLHGPLLALMLVAGYGVVRCVKYHHL